ncbi:hypothetical protein [Gluconobacter oxydans]|uniref:hypothetical protein n=1 Tax=Gluconobacter oxydans TaxID=442 RepID=UPI0039E7E296
MSVVSTCDLSGVWTNQYGSVLHIRDTGTLLIATYSSSMGNVGTYRTVGMRARTRPGAECSVPVAFAVSWRSLGPEPRDPCWNWSSGMCGSVCLAGDRPVMKLSHLLLAGSPFPGLASPGTYLGTLEFFRDDDKSVTDVPDALRKVALCEPGTDLLSGGWRDDDGTMLVVSVTAEEHGRFGYVDGTLHLAGENIALTGLTDIEATRYEGNRQAVSIVAATETQVYLFAGFLGLKRSGLSLFALQETPTPSSQDYVRTALSFHVLCRQKNP